MLFYNPDSEHFQKDIPQGILSISTEKMDGRQGPNEDSCACFLLKDSLVMAVADGVGGHSHGDEASKLVLRVLKDFLAKLEDDKDMQVRSAILDAFEAANLSLLENFPQAATTLAVLQATQSTYRSYHVGDSSAFCFGRRGKLKYQTLSHSPTDYGIQAGLLNEQQAIEHEERHFVLNVLGSKDMRIDVGPVMDRASKDVLVLCSDGLTDNLTLEEMAQTVLSSSKTLIASNLFLNAKKRMQAESTLRGNIKPDDLTLLTLTR